MALRGYLARQGVVALVLCVLAGCQVPTEGAPCQSDASCPRGQRCGADGRCSVKAAKCTECADAETKCVEKDLLHCTKALDGICRVFGDPATRGQHQVCDSTDGPKLVCEPTGCAAEGLACAGGATWITCAVDTDGCLFYSESDPSVACAPGLLCGSAAKSCICPAASGNKFYVDPVAGSEVGAEPAPTGAEAPPGCRFKALGPAVDAANEHARSPAGAATVMVSAGGTPFTFTEAAIELVPGVTLTSDAPTNPTGPPADLPYVLEVSGASAGEPGVPGVTLHEGATFSGLKLQPAADARVTDAILAECASGATQEAKVQDAIVLGTNGEGRFGNGVHQKDGCPVTVERTLLEVDRVGVLGDGGGLRTEADEPELKVDACTVRGGQTGILLQPVTGSRTKATISGTRVEHATETGIQLMYMSGSTVILDRNTVTQNSATVGHGGQIAGGILLLGSLPATTFTGNRVFGNSSNQVLVYNNDGSLNLSGGTTSDACGNTANQLCPPGGGQPGVGVYSTGATVTAWYNSWAHDPAHPAVDYGGNVDANGSQNDKSCPPADCCSAPATCP